MTDHTGFCAVGGSWSMGGGGVRDSDDIRFGVHGVRNSPWSKEGEFGSDSAHRDRFHCRGKHSGGWGLRWGIHEPGSVIRTRGGELELGQPLGLLGRTTYRRWARRRHLWGYLHLPHPRAGPLHWLLNLVDEFESLIRGGLVFIPLVSVICVSLFIICFLNYALNSWALILIELSWWSMGKDLVRSYINIKSVKVAWVFNKVGKYVKCLVKIRINPNVLKIQMSSWWEYKIPWR